MSDEIKTESTETDKEKFLEELRKTVFAGICPYDMVKDVEVDWPKALRNYLWAIQVFM